MNPFLFTRRTLGTTVPRDGLRGLGRSARPWTEGVDQPQKQERFATMNTIRHSLLSLTAVVWLFASGSAHAATECNGTLTGTIPDGVVVNSGFCKLQGANVAGGLRVTAGVVVVCGSTINGGFISNGAANLIFGAEEIGCDGDVINGAVHISNTGPGLLVGPPSIALERSTINGGVTLSGNQGQIAVAGNRISGRLVCSNNAFPLDNEGMTNIVSGPVLCTFK